MGRLSTFVFGVIVGVVLTFGSQRYHVVRASDGFHLVPKLSASFSQAYVDVRSFGIADWAEHRGLAGAIIRAKKDHLLKGSATDQLRDGLHDAVDALTGAND